MARAVLCLKCSLELGVLRMFLGDTAPSLGLLARGSSAFPMCCFTRALEHLGGDGAAALGVTGGGSGGVGTSVVTLAQTLFSVSFGRLFLQKMSRKSDNNNILDISLAQKGNRNSMGMPGLLIHPQR